MEYQEKKYEGKSSLDFAEAGTCTKGRLHLKQLVQ